ncbi:Protein ALWAYS EARLY 2 [Raphanus sativus]|nr:Protein ALWAYS EARLY 2 [Raphanus sativus]
MIALILHGKVSTNTSSSPHALDEKEMEPEMLEIVGGSETRAQAMVDAAIKVASSVKEGEDAIKMIQEALDMVGKHQPLPSSVVIKHEYHTNGGTEHQQNPSPSDASKPKANNNFISQDGSEKKRGSNAFRANHILCCLLAHDSGLCIFKSCKIVV